MTESPNRQHVCLVSGQLLPNLIPVLMDRPAKVHLMVTEGMQSNAKRLQKILADHDLMALCHDAVPSSEFTAIMAYAERMAETLGDAFEGESLVLNATGGTKLMSLAFYTWFKEIGANVIYTDTDRQLIESLTDTECPMQPMQQVIDVEVYLSASGMTLRRSACQDLEWRHGAQIRKSLSKWLAAHAAQLSDFFGALNKLATDALDHKGELLRTPTQYFESLPRGIWQQAMHQINAAGLVEWNGTHTVRFMDAESARYLSGAWLEEYAWHIVSDEQVFDVKTGVECTWDGSGRQAARNEFDVLTVHNNRLLVMECKTSRFGVQPSADSNILYKLESLGSNAGGLFGKMLLLSARPLSDTERTRANSQRIDVLEGAEIAGLRDYVQRWKTV